MTGLLRVIMLVGALGTLIYMLRQISRSRMEIEYSIFWALFSGMLVLLGLFPQIAIRAAIFAQIESPINAVFLIIIFVLIIKLFGTTMRISKMQQQLTRMAQHIALHEYKEKQAEQPRTNSENK
ncbi:MAG: DUF2304 domain-containing protein [Ruthenibacterium sp.]